MRINNEIRKCVCFVGFRMADDSYRFAGTAFWLGKEKPGDPDVQLSYLVTARHVIDGIKAYGLTEVWLRLNHSDGTSKWFYTPIDQWFSHESDNSIDVSILFAGIPPEFDHLIYPFSLCLTADGMVEHEVDLGDEVFVVGLFRHHHGNNKNIPIVRVGNLASIGEERVVTKAFGEIDAMLIEARSIGGLSGSPVLLNFGVARMIKGKVRFATGEMQLLMGLVHGHFDTPQATADFIEEDENTDGSIARVNTGIAVVVPFHSISEVIDLHEQSVLSKIPSAE